jgi:hypothetical protein
MHHLHRVGRDLLVREMKWMVVEGGGGRERGIKLFKN